jgi:hypothetical protein
MREQQQFFTTNFLWINTNQTLGFEYIKPFSMELPVDEIKGVKTTFMSHSLSPSHLYFDCSHTNKGNYFQFVKCGSFWKYLGIRFILIPE